MRARAHPHATAPGRSTRTLYGRLADVVAADLPTFGGNSDFVQALTAEEVRVIVVGGLAVHYYCPERAVDDLDLLIEPTEHAGSVVLNVLVRFNDAASFRPEDLAKPNRQYRQKRALYLDLLTPRAEEDFDALWSRALPTSLNRVPVRVAALQDLLSGLDRNFGDVFSHAARASIS